MVFKNICVLVIWMLAASALEGVISRFITCLGQQGFLAKIQVAKKYTSVSAVNIRGNPYAASS